MKRLLLRAAALLAAGPLTAAEPTLTLDLGDGVTLDLLLVRAGGFTQGSPPDEPGRGGDETARPVRLTQDYYMGRTSVTRGQWMRFVTETGFRSEAETGTSGGFGWDGTALVQRKEFTWRNPGFLQDASHPVCIVTVPDAQAFCRWLGQRVGRVVDLPTEAQWEHACRAGTTTAWHAGDDPSPADLVAWHKGNAGNGTRPADSRPPNPWGLVIGGNVAEWCLDWYAPYAPGPQTDPLQQVAPPSDKPRRVLRGGSWARDAKNTRSAARFRSDPRSRNADIGFRIVCATAPFAESPVPRPPAAPAPAPAPTPPRVETPAMPAPPAPPPSNMPRPSPGSGRGFSPLVGLLCMAVPLLAIVLLIRMAARRGRATATARAAALPPRPAPPSAAPPRGPLRVRVVDDGFWIHSEWPPGTPVQLTYTVAGEAQRQRVIYQPGPDGHYIFTGRRPASVSATIDDEPTPPPVLPTAFPTEEPARPEPTPQPRAAAWTPPPSRPSAY